jgi:hypothetical protein
VPDGAALHPALFDQILTWVFRGLGALYAVGGAYVVHNLRLMLFLSRSVDKLEQMLREAGQPSMQRYDPEDRGRLWWLLAGGIITFVSGIAMLAASRLSTWLLVLLLIHQALYLVRQTRRVKAAQTYRAVDEAMPTPSMVQAFGWTIPFLALALYLTYRGLLT